MVKGRITTLIQKNTKEIGRKIRRTDTVSMNHPRGCSKVTGKTIKKMVMAV